MPGVWIRSRVIEKATWHAVALWTARWVTCCCMLEAVAVPWLVACCSVQLKGSAAVGLASLHGTRSCRLESTRFFLEVVHVFVLNRDGVLMSGC